MRILLNKLFCAKQMETKKLNGHIETKNIAVKKSADPGLWRDLLAYWLLGLGTEIGYIVMICAATDILHGLGNLNVIYSCCLWNN